ncbi:MAG: cytochrome b/b6 domain-containing protein, partial [Pseudorhodoplanes sp.]|nr:cytochrome b/b6 domain-containing protein [Pseudorhodoplanes sp.]
MTGFLAHIRFAAAALAVIFLIGVSAPAGAQQVNPTASSVKEEQLLQQLQRVQGRITIPDAKESVLIQPAGRDWRTFDQITLRWIGAISILGMLLLIVGFFLTRGMIRIERGRSGRTIVRFNAFERFVHWMTATCFIILAISGLNITFGRPLLLPLMSPEAFTAWSQWLKYAHNYLSFPFTFGVILLFLMWIGGNIPSKTDVEWLKAGGGLFGHREPPSGRFNG